MRRYFHFPHEMLLVGWTFASGCTIALQDVDWLGSIRLGLGKHGKEGLYNNPVHGQSFPPFTLILYTGVGQYSLFSSFAAGRRLSFLVHHIFFVITIFFPSGWNIQYISYLAYPLHIIIIMGEKQGGRNMSRIVIVCLGWDTSFLFYLFFFL